LPRQNKTGTNNFKIMDKIEEIKKLKSLLDQEAITLDEYNLLKKNVLENEEKISVRKPRKSTTIPQISKDDLNTQILDTPPKIKLENQNKRKAPTFLSNNFVKGALVVGIVLLLSHFLGSFNNISKKQFKTLDDLTSALHGEKYDDVKAILGEPYFKYLDVVKQEITYRWHGVGVIGRPDAVIIFDAFEFSGSYSGRNFNSVYFSEKDWDGLRGNDDTFRIE